MKSLKAANAEDRSMAAIVLVKHYRQPIFIPGKGQQLQPLDAEESKLILKNLLEAQWPNPPQPINYQYNPAIAFNMLGLGPQDGFQNVPNGVYSQQYTDAAKAWLTKNWQTYRIQRYLGAANGVNGGTTPGESTPIKAPAFRR